MSVTLKTFQDSLCTMALSPPLVTTASSLSADTLLNCFSATSQLVAQGFSWYSAQCTSTVVSQQALDLYLWTSAYNQSTSCPLTNSSTYYSYGLNDQGNANHNGNTCVQGNIAVIANDRRYGNLTSFYGQFLCTTSSAAAPVRLDSAVALLSVVIAMSMFLLH